MRKETKVSNTEINNPQVTHTPQDIYVAVVADQGLTEANTLAKNLGLKNFKDMMVTLGLYISKVLAQTGEVLPFPVMNTTIITQGKTTVPTVSRSSHKALFQISPRRLAQFGMENVATFKMEKTSEDTLVFTVLSQLGGENPMYQDNSDPTNSGTNLPKKRRGRRPRNQNTAQDQGGLQENESTPKPYKEVSSSSTPTSNSEVIITGHVTETGMPNKVGTINNSSSLNSPELDDNSELSQEESDLMTFNPGSMI